MIESLAKRAADRRGTAVVAALLLLLAVASGATTVDPYLAVVDVDNRSEPARVEAFRAGLQQVLRKLSGRSPDQFDPGIAERFVAQYRYLEGRVGAPPESLRLEIRFDAAGVRDLARRLGLALWPLERGDTVIWIAIEERGERTLLGVDPDHAGWLEQIEEFARARGLPIVLPLLDLEDQARISAAELWGGFYERIGEASQRYGADHVLFGRLAPDRGGAWTARWALDAGGGVLRWQRRSESVEDALRLAIDGAATRLAQIFAIPLSEAGATTLSVRVSGVRSPRDYARLTSYLAGLSPVTRVQLDQVEQDRVRFRIETGADPEMLARVLARSDMIEPDPAGAADGLHYRLAVGPAAP